MSEPLSNKKHQYECICCHCGKPFYGDKREVSCPNCSKTNRSLSKVFQFKRKPSPTYFPANEGYNLCLDELDQRSPDVIELAKIIHQESGSVESWETCSVGDRDYAISVAQEIINKIDVWVVKKG